MCDRIGERNECTYYTSYIVCMLTEACIVWNFISLFLEMKFFGKFVGKSVLCLDRNFWTKPIYVNLFDKY